jgi:hypothetical protein
MEVEGSDYFEPREKDGRDGGRGSRKRGVAAQDARILRLLAYFLAGKHEEENGRENWTTMEEEESEEKRVAGGGGDEGERDRGRGELFHGVRQQSGTVLDPEGRIAHFFAAMVGVASPFLRPLHVSLLPSLPPSLSHAFPSLAVRASRRRGKRLICCRRVFCLLVFKECRMYFSIC